LLLVCSACSDHNCTLVACSGSQVVALVDATGNAVAARGELLASGSSEAVAFDCTTKTLCDARMQVQVTDGDKLRFELSGGDWSEWVTFDEADFEPTETTDPDFNGPGCPCTWTDLRATLEVPAEAQSSPSTN